MNHSHMAIAGLAVLGAVVPAVTTTGASASIPTHTISFTSHVLKDHKHGQHDIEANRDVQKGKLVGFDITDCTFSPPKTFACTGTVARNAGMIYTKFRFHASTGTASGKITGGTGDYKGATGTLSAKALNKRSTKVALTYHTS